MSVEPHQICPTEPNLKKKNQAWNEWFGSRSNFIGKTYIFVIPFSFWVGIPPEILNQNYFAQNLKGLIDESPWSLNLTSHPQVESTND